MLNTFKTFNTCLWGFLCTASQAQLVESFSPCVQVRQSNNISHRDSREKYDPYMVTKNQLNKSSEWRNSHAKRFFRGSGCQKQTIKDIRLSILATSFSDILAVENTKKELEFVRAWSIDSRYRTFKSKTDITWIQFDKNWALLLTFSCFCCFFLCIYRSKKIHKVFISHWLVL